MRRFFVSSLHGDGLALPPAAAHHVAVLRLPLGTRVQLFSEDGASVDAELDAPGHARFVSPIVKNAWQSGVTVAVPLVKGDRQDWLIEKLCELGVDTWVPLLTERAVIRELSGNKRERYARLVAAACKQCGRNVPMQLAPLTPLEQLSFTHAVILDPRAATPMAPVLPLTLVLGPEGGLTEPELSALQARGAIAARIAPFVLRVETAALAAAAVAMAGGPG